MKKVIALQVPSCSVLRRSLIATAPAMKGNAGEHSRYGGYFIGKYAFIFLVITRAVTIRKMVMAMYL